MEEVLTSLRTARSAPTQNVKQVAELEKQVAELEGVVTLYKKIIEDAKDNLYTVSFF